MLELVYVDGSAIWEGAFLFYCNSAKSSSECANYIIAFVSDLLYVK